MASEKIYKKDFNNMLLRGSFLHERTFAVKNHGAIPDMYVAALHPLQLAARASSSISLHQRISRLEHQARALPQAGIPEWYQYLSSVLNVETDATPAYLRNFPFITALAPLVAVFTQELRGTFPDLSLTIMESAQTALLRRLLQVAGVTLYTDYQEYCRRTGKTPSLEIYEQWSRNFLNGEWGNIADTYPVLIRFIHMTHSNFLTLATEVIQRFYIDKNNIAELIDTNKDITLENIIFDLSDYHHDGRTVCRLLLNEGNRVIYKPKSMANEEWFFSCLLPKLPTFAQSIGHIGVINRHEYGWAEDITKLIADKPDAEMPLNIGRIVALFYALNATDMHAENMIFHDGKAYPIDVETILNSVPGSLRADDQTWKTWSVLSTELLQYKYSRSAMENRGNGFSAAASYAPFKKIYFSYCTEKGIEIDFYDPSIFDPETLEEESSAKAPEMIVDPQIFCEAYTEITDVYRNSQLKVPTEMVTRHIFRDTMFYERIVQRLSQPKLLTDGALLSLDLAGLYIDLKNLPESDSSQRACLIDHEITQLLAGDVPLFWHSPHSKDLMSHNGLVAKDFYKKTGYECFHDKIIHAEPEDIREQSYLMEASFIKNEGASVETAHDKKASVDKNSVLDHCRKMALLTISRAIIKTGKQAQWVSYLSDTSGKTLQPAIVGNSYYSGYWGILSFLMAAHSVLEANNQTCTTLKKFLEHEAAYWRTATLPTPDDIASSGLGIAGIGGELIALTLLYERDSRWKFVSERIEHIVSAVPDHLINQDVYHDVIGGNAGLLLALTRIVRSSLFKKMPHESRIRIQSLSHVALQRLIDSAQPQEKGLAWLPKQGEDKPLLGYAHGTAGIICAIQAICDNQLLFSISEECLTIARNVIVSALEYQSSQKHEASGSWIDLRSIVPENGPLNASWCHGWAGLGLCYIGQIRNEFSDEVVSAYKNICKTALHSDADTIDYYCCGTAGMVDFLLEAARLSNDNDLYTHARDNIAQSLHNLKELTHFTSRFGRIDPKMFPGLFQGITGIGYTALRLIDPALPSLCGFSARNVF